MHPDSGGPGGLVGESSTSPNPAIIRRPWAILIPLVVESPDRNRVPDTGTRGGVERAEWRGFAQLFASRPILSCVAYLNVGEFLRGSVPYNLAWLKKNSGSYSALIFAATTTQAISVGCKNFHYTMWRLASKAITGKLGLGGSCTKLSLPNPDCSDDDEVSSCASKEDGLDCPICWESFNIVENVPYVLWCGHTLCKHCVLGLQSAVVKLPTVPIRLPLFISCPWCNVLSFRVNYKGNLRFPRKNYFLLWMVERMNGDRQKSQSTLGQCHSQWPSSNSQLPRSHAYHHHNQVASDVLAEQPNSSQSGSGFGIYFDTERIHSMFRNSLAFIIEQTAKIPLVVIFLIIVLYAIPASAAILVLYILITVLFAVPSILILYFAYPSLDWLVREILT